MRIPLVRSFVVLLLMVAHLCVSEHLLGMGDDSQPQAPKEFPGLGEKGALQGIQFEAASEVRLIGKNARRQLVVTGEYTSGQEHDLTRTLTWQVQPEGIVRVDSNGFVLPLQDGKAKVTATEPTGHKAEIELSVERTADQLPINFENEIVPIFTKLGCNTGGCHGKADGQNGFKLSLLGFYPEEDFEFLVKEDRGRRIFPPSPEFSLLLTKPANQSPHGGGMRLQPGSYEWNLILNWIEQGTPYGQENDPKISHIETFPSRRSMNRESQQQLTVIAHYTDGSTRDVTQIAQFESNDVEMAESTATGLVTTKSVPGDVAVMVRFQGEVTVFRANIPLGLQVTGLPPAKNLIDEHVFRKLQGLGIPPSAICDDSTFLRRACNDIAGRLPTGDEARAFLVDTNPNKRVDLVNRLVDSEGYADYFANKWSAILRNKRRNQTDIQYTYRFHDWIRDAIASNMPYDEFVRNVLVASGDVESHPPVAWYKEASSSTLQMEDTAQLFLGLRIQCARCHHHPFEKWSQQDYYGFEAFFSQVGMKAGPFSQNNIQDRVYHKGGVAKSRNPRSGEDVLPTGLGGKPLEIPAYEDPRHRLVDWMTAKENPFFAKAMVNRYWKHFMGRGIVDPEDDMRVTNPPSNPELLDGLAQHFIDSGYNMKDLVRTICTSQVYQLSSTPNDYNGTDKLNFSRFYPRRMNAEPLHDAVTALTGVSSNFGGVPRGMKAVQLPDTGFNDYFLEVFGRPEAESACECERSSEANLAQSLHLLNSSDVQGKLTSGQGRLNQLAQDKDLQLVDKLVEIYYAAYARPPQPSELKFLMERIEKRPNQKEALEDVTWAIINSKEFLFIQ